MANKSTHGRTVYIVDGSRTPFLKARNQMGPFSAADLAQQTCRELLARQPFKPSDLSEVITGCVMPDADEANISRVIALRIGCGNKVPAFTVQRNCGSGLQAIDTASQNISQGRSDLVLAGGTEAMSHAPLMLNDDMVNWLGKWMTAKTIGQRLKMLPSLRLHYLKPVFSLLKGLCDPVVGLSMGQTAEVLAYRFGITRQQMDEYAVESHARVLEAQHRGYLSEITPLYAKDGKVYLQDDGVRSDTSIETLSKLKPFFDKRFGMVTAGNSSQVTDGAAYVILASEEAVKRYKLPVKAKIIDIAWAALDPKQMGLGPVHATTALLQRHSLALSDIDFWEINEAFAAQVLACLAAWQDDDYCQKELGLKKALGQLNQSHLNVDGGAVALGHPIGTSGARLALHMLEVLQREQATRGIVAMCIGGGQGGAMLIERVKGDKL